MKTKHILLIFVFSIFSLTGLRLTSGLFWSGLSLDLNCSWAQTSNQAADANDFAPKQMDIFSIGQTPSQNNGPPVAASVAAPAPSPTSIGSGAVVVPPVSVPAPVPFPAQAPPQGAAKNRSFSRSTFDTQSILPNTTTATTGVPAAGALGKPATPETATPKIVILQDGETKEFYRAEEGDPSVVLRTSLGDITLRLFKSRTPNTVRHFLSLVKGEKLFKEVTTGRLNRRPFYNGLLFHRVIKDFMIQTGCPFGNGRGDIGERINDEIKPDLGFDEPGMVAMALRRAKNDIAPQPNSASSQFFITLKPLPELEKKYTIFGKVISGMNIVRRIASVRVGPTDRPIKKVTLISVEAFDAPPAQPVLPSKLKTAPVTATQAEGDEDNDDSAN